MGSRTLPTECHHGVTVDWGDFGPCQGCCDIEGHGWDECPDHPGCEECDREAEAVREMRWTLFEESVRGFLLEHHLPLDTADEWTDEIVACAKEQLMAQWWAPDPEEDGE